MSAPSLAWLEAPSPRVFLKGAAAVVALVVGPSEHECHPGDHAAPVIQWPGAPSSPGARAKPAPQGCSGLAVEAAFTTSQVEARLPPPRATAQAAPHSVGQDLKDWHVGIYCWLNPVQCFATLLQ